MKISRSHCFIQSASERTSFGHLSLLALVQLLLISVAYCDTPNGLSPSTVTTTTTSRKGNLEWSYPQAGGSPFDWQPIEWHRPNGELLINWRRISVDNEDHERQSLEKVANADFKQLGGSLDGLEEHSGDHEGLGLQSSSRQTRQVDSSKQKTANSNIHILSQEHVILDNHSNPRRHSAYHSSLNSPRSLVFFQSSRSGSDASDNAEAFYIRKGANGTLPCLPVLPADSQATQNKIEWFKGEKKLMEAESKRIVVWNTKNSIAYLPETGALLFRGVTNEDSGEYHCVLTKTTENVSEEGVVRFYVQDAPDPLGQPIVIGFTQRSVNLSWVSPYDVHHSPILHYIVHVREGVDGSWDVANGIMTPDNRTYYEMIGLKPFTTYSFRVLAVNAIGVSEPSPPSHYIITLRQKPDSRLNIISARNVSSSAIKLEWLPPSAKEIHGEFLGYRIRFVPQFHEHTPPGQNQSSHYHSFGSNSQQRQPSLDGPLAQEAQLGDTKATSYVINKLQTFTPYKISVQVSNPAGDGPVAEVLAMTDEGVASAPLDLSALKTTDSSVKLRWLEPKSPNGILQGYQIVLHDIASNLNETRRLTDSQSRMEHTINDLKPYTWYLVQVQAYSRKFIGELSQPVKFRTDVSAPSAPQLTNVTCYSQDSILIQWLRPEEFYNQIDFYYVRYKPRESGWDYTGQSSKEEETALVAKKDSLLGELLITNLTAEQTYELKVLSGTRSVHNQSHIYRSEPSQTFRVVLRANCESYTASPITENTFNTSLAIGVVCASFALALVTALLIVWRRHCQAAYYYLDEPQDASRGTNSPQLSETYDDSEYGSIPVADWIKHVQKLHQDSDIGFSREFEQIQQANQKQSLAVTCEHSQLPENKHKNRYINIVAYDHTRVVLQQPLGGQKKPGFDYINANFIDGYNKPRAYIGTQGPLVSTFDDYWRMIWEQRVVIIVMITNLQERGRRKCDMYWPKEGSDTYGYVQVTLIQEVVMATYTLRTFTIRNLKLKGKRRPGGIERTVYQYHYTNWPDHGVPDHPLPVLSFVRKSAASNPPGGGAIICHCSAGCGRSGTYIVIDAMLKQIRAKQSINVVDFLKHIRAQRNYLVQTEEQYIFIHDALVEVIESGDTEIPVEYISKYLQLLQTGGGGVGQCNTSVLSNGSNYSLQNGLAQAAVTNCPHPNSNLYVVTANANNNNSDQQQLLSSSSNSNLLLANGKTSQATTVSRSQSGQWSLLERQYRLVANFKAKDFCVVSALKPCNKNKNRTLNLIPLENHRVHITPKPGTDGSDYINATFLMGFNHLREFIVTQHPVQETFSDFWQMVYDHNSQTIVLLTPMGGPNDDCKEFAQFWPHKEDEVDYGSFKVKLTQESILKKEASGGLIITRDFIMRSNQDDYELQTRIIHCPGWPECCGPLSAVFDLIQVVKEATEQQADQQRLHDGQLNSVTRGLEHEPQNGGPVIVVDKYGGTEAASFSVLTTLFKQINFDKAADVYMYAKLAHLRRPGIWCSQDDYLFLYRAIENYAQNWLAEQQKERDKSATAASLKAPISLADLHHRQTMTLGRHGHHNKSSPVLSNTLKASTMKRQPSKSANPAAAQPAKQQHFQPVTSSAQHLSSPATHLNHGAVANEFMAIRNNQKSLGDGQQMLVDHNHNSLQYPSTVVMQRQLQQQQQQMAKVSPYNSAASIGAGSHQHLLAASNGPSLLHQQHQQQLRHQAGPTVAFPLQAAKHADHQYLYSVQ